MRSCCSPRSRGCGAAVCTGCMRRRMRTWMRWPRAGGAAGCRLRRWRGGGGVPAGGVRPGRRRGAGAAGAGGLLDGVGGVRALASVRVVRGAGDAGLAARLAGLAEAGRDRGVTDLVRVSAAAVLGHVSAEAVEPGRAFRDLGFDSLTAVELRDRLNTATGLRLPSTVVFDYPSAVTLARHVLRLLRGTAQAAPPAAAAAATGEPIAIVGLSCQYPGGASSPEDLWGLLAAAGDAISGFPSDRGWNLEALFDPDPDHPGTAYVSRGGFVVAT